MKCVECKNQGGFLFAGNYSLEGMHSPLHQSSIFMKIFLFAIPLLAFFPVGTIAQAADSYPLATCVVSDEKLGEMAPPVVINYKGREVRFCCNGCVKKFNADPEKYLAKLKADKSAK